MMRALLLLLLAGCTAPPLPDAVPDLAFGFDPFAIPVEGYRRPGEWSTFTLADIDAKVVLLVGAAYS